MIYPVMYEPDGQGGVIASLPDLPGTYDCGATESEAAARLAGAALAIIQSLIDDGEPVPDPSPPAGRDTLALPSQAWAKVLLYRALRDSGWRPADLASALGIDAKAAGRLLSVAHASRWESMDAAFRALGLTFTPTVQAA